MYTLKVLRDASGNANIQRFSSAMTVSLNKIMKEGADKAKARARQILDKVYT